MPRYKTSDAISVSPVVLVDVVPACVTCKENQVLLGSAWVCQNETCPRYSQVTAVHDEANGS